jgi:uncharacterized protein (DUF927 family)
MKHFLPFILFLFLLSSKGQTLITNISISIWGGQLLIHLVQLPMWVGQK